MTGCFLGGDIPFFLVERAKCVFDHVLSFIAAG